ncbi:MAG TPA: hypothetical protein VIP98_24770, partial [Microlunatus sp.]
MTGQTKINIGPVGADGDRWQDGESADRIVRHLAWRLAVRAGELADLTYAGRPVLRGIRFVVRDHDWRTAEDVLTGVEQPGTDSLILNVRSRFDHQDVLEWTLRATFDDATLRVRVEARALAQFRRNRIGLILLHHPDLAGSALEVVHPDDSITEAVFPTRIAPHQPARDVAGYRWRAAGIDCSLRLAGDIFEMEDQRNWTDASYKTYSTPLDLPFPVEIGPGARIEQAVELHCTDVAGAADVPPSPAMIMPRASALPVIQVAASTAPGQPDPGAQEPIPVLVEIPADDDCWSAVLQRAVDDAAGADLDVRIVADRPAQVAPVIARLAAGPARDRISRVGVFGRASSMSDRDLGHALAAAMTKHGLRADQVAGTRAHFTELNRHL